MSGLNNPNEDDCNSSGRLFQTAGAAAAKANAQSPIVEGWA